VVTGGSVTSINPLTLTINYAALLLSFVEIIALARIGIYNANKVSTFSFLFYFI
jgi:hypothetical protein